MDERNDLELRKMSKYCNLHGTGPRYCQRFLGIGNLGQNVFKNKVC